MSDYFAFIQSALIDHTVVIQQSTVLTDQTHWFSFGRETMSVLRMISLSFDHSLVTNHLSAIYYRFFTLIISKTFQSRTFHTPTANNRGHSKFGNGCCSSCSANYRNCLDCIFTQFKLHPAHYDLCVLINHHRSNIR